ncbi:molybdopterin-dependent oxidoreductase [Marinimicrobium sp. ARAG 43.8]
MRSPPEKSFFYASGRSSNEVGFLLQLLARLYGSNNVTNCSYYCHQATGVGLQGTMGTGTATVQLEDLAHADMVFVIGANPASNHPRFVHQLKNCRDRGGKVMVINPAKEPGPVRFAVPKSAKSMLSGGTWIASRFIQPSIGSDLALLTALAKLTLENSAHNAAFVDDHTQGFADYKHSLDSLDLDDLLAQCGVPEQELRAMAEDYARAENVIFAWGMGITHHLNGVANVEAIANLALLRGMVGKPGAGMLPLRGHSNVQGIGTIGVKPVLADDVLKAMEAQMGVTLPSQPGLDTLACLRAAEAGEMRNAIIMGGNLFDATPDTAFARRAMDKVNFKLYLTTTLNRSHFNGMENSEALVLPVCARDEEPQSTTQESMFNYVRLSDGGITRLTNVRSEVSVLAQLEAKLLPKEPLDFSRFEAYDKVRQAIADTIPGMAPLADIGTCKKEFIVGQRILHEPVFNTPSGRAAFKTLSMPVHEKTAYPYQLASIRSEGQFNSIIYEEADSYRGTQHRWCVLVSHDDCQRLGLTKGATVTLTSAHGEMKNVEVVPFDLPAGSVMAYYPEANVLIGTEHDPRSKTPAFKSVPVSIKVGIGQKGGVQR